MLDPLTDFLLDHQLFFDAGLLGDYRFFDVLFDLNTSLFEGLLVASRRTVHGATLNSNVLLAKVNILADRFLYDIAANPNSAMAHIAFSDAKGLLGDGDYFFCALSASSTAQRRCALISRPALRPPFGCALVHVDGPFIIKNGQCLVIFVCAHSGRNKIAAS